MSCDSNQPSSHPPNTIKISIVSDITCAWCYIGWYEIKRAIARLQLAADSPIKFDIEHRPFLLNPAFKDDEVHTTQYIVERMGVERWERAVTVLKQRASDLGLTVSPNVLLVSTWKVHRLLLLAWNKGGSELQGKLLNILYEANFTRCENMGNADVLAKYAEDVGLMTKDEALEFLHSDELKSEVQRMVSCAQRSGVTGVPFTVINGRWAISGGQDSDVFYPLFEKLVQGQEP
ncbi:thioredoxin-like protein [Hysterangium stoloniferum]|nr:thioredoxin-like protein [Hysterangium stoloniferum]